MRYFVIFAVLLTAILGCESGSYPEVQNQLQAGEPSESEMKTEGVVTVCIWDRGVLRTKPSLEHGKWISSMALGEKVTWLNESYVDSTDNNREFLKIRLSDGKEGWTVAYVLVRDAKPAAITQKTFLHRRPDILTITEKYFDPMELLAITKTDGDWLEVVGNQRKKTGWIKNEGITLKDADVAVANMVWKAFSTEDPEKRRAILEAIIENPDLANSVFLNPIRHMLSPNPSAEETLEGTRAPIEPAPNTANNQP